MIVDRTRRCRWDRGLTFFFWALGVAQASLVNHRVVQRHASCVMFQRPPLLPLPRFKGLTRSYRWIVRGEPMDPCRDGLDGEEWGHHPR